jgi:hypothetical protein
MNATNLPHLDWDAIEFSMVLYGIIVALMFSLTILEVITRELTPFQAVRAIVAILGMYAVLIIFTAILDTSMAFVFTWLKDSSKNRLKVLIPLIVILLGFFAHWFKRRNKKWYGICEIAVGAFGAVKLADGINSADLTVFIGFCTSAYVVSRGLGNLSDAGITVDMGTILRAARK